MDSRQTRVAADKATRSIRNLGRYFSEIPIKEIVSACKKQGLVPIQEDGTKYSGVFAGREGTAIISLADLNEYTVDQGFLIYTKKVHQLLFISWYKLDLVYEIKSFIS